jgi:hypothetical protein
MLPPILAKLRGGGVLWEEKDFMLMLDQAKFRN